jgi:hypothetical protein
MLATLQHAVVPMWGSRGDNQIRLTADIRKGLIFSRTAEGRVRVNGGCKE